jgi:hypothetical protein
MIHVVRSHELVHSVHVALTQDLLEVAADESFVVLLGLRHRSFLLLIRPTRVSLAGAIHHAHDATRRDALHRLEAYSSKCLEKR